METIEKYLRSNCDKNGVSIGSDILTPEERAGLDELKVGVETKDWLVYTTDKSGKVVLDTKTNFLECMKEHYMKDEVVSPDKVRDAEHVINNHARSWIKIFNIGGEAGSGQ